jgi:hypothetical protein
MFCNRAISRAWTGGYLVTINKLERLDWGSQPHQRTDAQNDSSFFLLLFGQPSTLTGIQQHTNPLYSYYYSYFLAIRLFGEHKTKEAADTMATPASLQTLASHKT